MNFADIRYAFFLGAVFFIYWLVLRKQNVMRKFFLLGMSYCFYAWWDYRFLALILITTVSTYVTGHLMSTKHRKGWLTSNIVLNIGILFVFKYFGFFSENLQRLLSVFGWNLDWFTVDILLPVGISFYTFQAIGYSVDVYRRKIEPCRDYLVFSTFIAYFPQLVAGPIERASHLIPELKRTPVWNRAQATSGLRMILFGVVKKVAVADILGILADDIFALPHLSPWLCLYGGLLFTIQIYCDFTAYSEIARGSSRLLGIDLMANFRFPYFSRNIVEFWHRWHISLMRWFRNYVYIPMGGNRRGKLRTYINITLVFIISGLWHGAQWTFVIWGGYWAVIYIFGKAVLKMRTPERSISISDLPSISVMFMTVVLGFFIFRTNDVEQISFVVSALPLFVMITVGVWIITRLLTLKSVICFFRNKWMKIGCTGALLVIFAIWCVRTFPICVCYYTYLPMFVVVMVEWRNRNANFPMDVMPRSKWARYSLYWLLMFFALLSENIEMSFIYFQF